MQEPKPENRAPDEHRMEMVSALEQLVPIMAGAVHYSPPAFCDSSPEGEPLTDLGREFVGVVYGMALDVYDAAYEAIGYLLPQEEAELLEVAGDVLERSELCVLFARGLMEDLPPTISAGGALERIHREAEAALNALLETDRQTSRTATPIDSSQPARSPGLSSWPVII